MFPHLRILLIALWSSTTAGVVVIAGLSAGLYDVSTFIAAGLFAAVFGISAGLLNWAYLRPELAREVGLLGLAPPDRGRPRRR